MIIDSVSNATRAPGKYTLRWDGKDNRGKFVAAGNYTVFIEVSRGWLKAPDSAVARLQIIDYLERTHHLSGAMADFRVDEQHARCPSRGPATARMRSSVAQPAAMS